MVEKDLISWNAMIALFAQDDQGKEALYLLYQMQHEGVLPDKLTFVSVLAAYASQAYSLN